MDDKEGSLDDVMEFEVEDEDVEENDFVSHMKLPMENGEDATASPIDENAQLNPVHKSYAPREKILFSRQTFATSQITAIMISL